MKSSDLKHGDVLLFDWQAHQTFYERAIRLITGSRFVHCGVVQEVILIENENGKPYAGFLFVLEQLQERRCEPVELYRPDPQCVIICMRPKFQPLSFNAFNVNHDGYNYWAIADSLINHALHRLTLKRWQFRTMLTKQKPDLRDCSQLVALVLGDKEWQTCEPDDFVNDQHFDNLGIIEW